MGNNLKNDLLRLAREERGWPQVELAQKIRMSEKAVRSWELGTRAPGLEARRRLCEIFGKTAAELGLEQNGAQQFPQEEQTAETPVGHDPNRRRMLKRVQTRWISGVLDHSLSLYEGILIPVRLRECSAAVVNPWASVTQESNLPSRSLSPETHILDVYDEADGGLLILGEPGAGKTTLLLELARDLIARARLDETHPMPVVFNLASWVEKRSEFQAWLVDELNSKYQVPRKLAQTWISENDILPLLDGLDEVAEEYRADSVQAINAYRREHGFVSLVVCSRASEYFALDSRVALNNAVTIEPLGWKEIENYLSKAGESLQGVQMALKSDSSLQEMASTPLMLNIIAQTFRVTSIEDILSVQDGARRRALIFEKYVEIVLKRRGPTNRYSPKQTMHWLAWLARQMQQHNQTEFYVERMQPDTLLPNQARQRFHQSMVQLVYCIEAFVLAAALAWLRGGRTFSGVGGGLLGTLGSESWGSVLGWMSPGLGVRGLAGGGLVSLVFAIVAVLVGIMIDRSALTDASEIPRWRRAQQAIFTGMRNGLVCGGLVGLFCLLLFGWRSGLLSGLSYGSSFGILTGLILGTISGLTTSLREEKPIYEKKRFLEGALPSFCALIGFLGVDMMLRLSDDFTYGFVVACFFYVLHRFGKGNGRIRIGPEIQPAEIVTWSWQSIRKNFFRDMARGSLIGLLTCLSVTLCIGLVSGIARGWAYGMALGFVFGPIIGVSVGVAAMLSGLLNSGLTSDIMQKQDMVRPNEGIHRSARNAMLAAAVFGPIGGIISGIACGVSFGLIGRLTSWSVLACGLALVFAILFCFYFLMVRGFIAYLEHFCLRYYLWRKGHTPLHCVRFLNYATERILLRRIGGGYMFAHHLLLEHFADKASQDEERDKFLCQSTQIATHANVLPHAGD